jgi:S-adenosylhomocysteine hydrolase
MTRDEFQVRLLPTMEASDYALPTEEVMQQLGNLIVDAGGENVSVVHSVNASSEPL